MRVLEVKFADGNVYQFVRVSAEVYAALMGAVNKYEYYSSHIMYP